jgi:hypothetical protein
MQSGPALEFPRFPQPDDIGCFLARGLREQVLAVCLDEAQETALQFPSGSAARDEHDRITASIQALQEQEQG